MYYVMIKSSLKMEGTHKDLIRCSYPASERVTEALSQSHFMLTRQ